MVDRSVPFRHTTHETDIERQPKQPEITRERAESHYRYEGEPFKPVKRASIRALVQNRAPNLSICVNEPAFDPRFGVNRGCRFDVQVELALMRREGTPGLEFNDEDRAVIFLNQAVNDAPKYD